MGYRVISFRDHGYHSDHDTEKFYEAAEMARRGVEKMRDLAEKMEHLYGERMYGMREHYPEHEYMRRRGDFDYDMYGERQMRDSRGRYM